MDVELAIRGNRNSHFIRAREFAVGSTAPRTRHHACRDDVEKYRGVGNSLEICSESGRSLRFNSVPSTGFQRARRKRISHASEALQPTRKTQSPFAFSTLSVSIRAPTKLAAASPGRHTPLPASHADCAKSPQRDSGCPFFVDDRWRFCPSRPAWILSTARPRCFRSRPRARSSSTIRESAPLAIALGFRHKMLMNESPLSPSPSRAILPPPAARSSAVWTPSSYLERMEFLQRKIFQCEHTNKTDLDYFAAHASELDDARTIRQRFPDELKARVLTSLQFRTLFSLPFSSHLPFCASCFTPIIPSPL